jgi:histidinol-phosphate phosphatase family protein
MKIVVLAGGKGTRLGLTDKPKPMVPIAGKPLLERILETAKGYGFEDFVFLTGHMGDVIADHFGDGTRFGVRLAHVREDTPLGTGGAVLQAADILSEPFVLIYGDILLDVDLSRLIAFHHRKGGVATLFVHPNDHPHDSDLVVLDADGRVASFLPKPHPDGAILPNLVSAAIYVLDPRALDFVPRSGSSDWGRDLFAGMIAAGERLYGYRSVEYAKDMGTPDRVAKGEADLASGKVVRLSYRQPKPAVFLDRDGVLNEEIDGVHTPGDLHLIDGVASQIKLLNTAGIPAICVTNQPDVAKGKMSTQDLAAVFDALDTRLAEGGAYLDDRYFCPHHPESGWPGEVAELKIDCECRKPKPGMLLAAAHDHGIDLGRSWLVGDRYTDVAAAHAAGVRAALVLTGHKGSDKLRFEDEADFIAADFASAIEHILGNLR